MKSFLLPYRAHKLGLSGIRFFKSHRCKPSSNNTERTHLHMGAIQPHQNATISVEAALVVSTLCSFPVSYHRIHHDIKNHRRYYITLTSSYHSSSLERCPHNNQTFLGTSCPPSKSSQWSV
jgi:hypothetical protein